MVQDQKKVTNQQSQPDTIELVKKYINIIWRNKLWIVLIFLTVSALWFVFYSMFLQSSPVYTAHAIIKFDDPRNSRRADAVTDFAETQSEAKVALLQTRSFLEKVVDSLKLNIILRTPGINRFDFFRHIELKENYQQGDYKLLNTNGRIEVWYSNKEEKIKNIKIQILDLPKESNLKLSLDGCDLELDRIIVNSYPEIQFSLLGKNAIISGIRQNLETRLDRSRTILTLGYKSSNPKVSATVINTIANFFVNQLLDYKKYTTTSVLKSLEDQLKAARSELESSEENLRRFREQNPYLMLSNGGANLVTSISTQQSDLDALIRNEARLNSLIQQKNQGESQDQTLIYLEVLSVLESQNVAGIGVLAEKYRELSAEKNRLLNQNYSPQHPQVLDVNKQIKELQFEIDNRLVSYKNQLTASINQLESSISVGQRDLRRLPGGELRLAELQRDRQVKENIYSNILVRYNEAKVSEAAIMPDAFLIEEAEIPTIEHRGINLKKLIVGPLFGLVLGIGLFVLLDMMDKTVKSSREVEQRLNLPVLATIPIIGNDKEIPDIVDLERKIDSKLITADYAPHIAGESFRILRTKAMMHIKESNRALLIASMNPGEGKSLVASNIAITFAQQKIPTVLIDCDLRRGVLHNSFACHKKPGLTDILVGQSFIHLQEISKVMQKTHIPNLFLISNGTQVPNPSELLGSQRMKEVIDLLRTEFGAVVVDTPPIEFIPDALVLNNFIHNIIFVVRYGKTHLDRIAEKIKEFSLTKADLMGVVINASEIMVEKKYDAYSYYHY